MAGLIKLSTQNHNLYSAPQGFVELMARSNYSFLQGASHPEEMIEQAIRLGYSGIALCDLSGLYGVVRGFEAASSPSHFVASLHTKSDFKYLIGSELLFQDDFSAKPSSIVLLPLSQEGYQNLCRLISLGKRHSPKGFSKISLSQLATHSEGLIAFPLPPWIENSKKQTKTHGKIPIEKHPDNHNTNLRENNIESQNIDRIEQLLNIFKDRLHLPVWRDFTYESRIYYQQALWFEKHWQIPLFVTQRPLMHTPERKPLLDVLTCILHHKPLHEAHNLLTQNRERHLKPLQELQKIWADRPDLLNNTVKIAEQVDFSLKQLRYRYPTSQIPQNLTASGYLSLLAMQGLKKRYPQKIPDKVLLQANKELDLIRQLEYEDYFLTLYDITLFARQKNILFQGRGSAANSVVCFALGLTSVDPEQIDLLFERFISKERNEPPDIDIDFEHERREEVIQYIYQHYGSQHAAMVATIIRFRSKLAIRETCKVFGFKADTIKYLVQHMGRDGIKRLLETPELCQKLNIDHKLFLNMLKIARELKGFPRHLGIHTGGFIITQNPIDEIVPVESASMQNRYVIQWNKDDVNFLGLMKVDVLSLGMLTAIRKSLELLKKHKDIHHSLASIPSEDPATYQMISQADTIGVFQIESRAQMATLPRMKPKTFYDLVIEVALIRPGPLQGGMVHPYLKRRKGLEKISYPHPDLEPILKKTLGVPIFQEQVMKIAVAAAGFTAGEADELRRVMSSRWKKDKVMSAVKERILSGLSSHGIAPKYAEQIYNTIEGFSAYGFPESHSASFALLTYASSYLKCHHPDVFTCALLNSQPMGFYSPRNLIMDAQTHGVYFLALDINLSDYEYTLEARQSSLCSIRQGFRSIFGIKKVLIDHVIEERQQRGAFRSLENLIARCKPSQSFLLKLASTGALSSLHPELSPKDMMWKILSINFDTNSLLFAQSKEIFEDHHIQFSESSWESLEREYQAQGFSLCQHPLALARPHLEKENTKLVAQGYVPYCNSQRLKKIDHQKKVRIAGLVSTTQRPPTAKGICFITLEDEWGLINILVPADVYQKYRLLIYQSPFLEVHGHIEKSQEVIHIKASRLIRFHVENLQKDLPRK